MKSCPSRLVIRLLLSFIVIGVIFGGNFGSAVEVYRVDMSSSPFTGDLHISGNNVTRITDQEFDITGNIIVEGNGTLVLENATVNFIQSVRRGFQYGLTLRNPANGRPRLIIKDAVLTSGFPFRVEFYGNSSVTADMLNAEVKGVRIYLEVHDSSVVSLSLANIFSLEVSGYSNVSVSTTLMSELSVEESSVVSAMSSEITRELTVEGSSTVNISGSKVNAKVRAYGNSRISMANGWMEKGELYVSDDSAIMISDLDIHPLKPPFEIEVGDRSVFSVSDSIIRRVELTAWGDSIVSIVRSSMTSGWVQAYDFSNVTVQDSKIDWLLTVRDSSIISSSNSALTLLRTEDLAKVSISNSTLDILRVGDIANVTVSNSTINEIFVSVDSVNCTLTSLQPGFFDGWAWSCEGCTGCVPSLFLDDVEISMGWNLWFFGASNVSIVDSMIESIGASDASVIEAVSCVSASFSASDESKISFWSHLRVRVVNRFGSPVKDANVRVWYDESVVGENFSQADGGVEFTLLEGVADASGTNHEGEYKVTAAFQGYEGEQLIKMSGNMEVTITLPLPWWFWHAIVGVVAVAAGVPTIVFLARKRRMKLRQASS
jgi:hypothetical protein